MEELVLLWTKGEPVWFANLLTVIIGLALGSFVNVLVHRLPRGESIVKPGSHCPSCKKPIPWWCNVPVISYILLRGKCRDCGKGISIRYPIVELLVALFCLLAKLRFGWGLLLVFRDWPFIAVMIAIFFIDLEHRIIPDSLSLGGLGLGLVTALAAPAIGILASFIGAAFGFGIFYLMALIYEKSTGRQGLGGGDIKFLAMLGAFLGVNGVFVTILLSSVLGSLVGIGWAVIFRKKNVMKTAIPYGPFLVAGGFFYYFLGDLLWFRFMTPM